MIKRIEKENIPACVKVIKDSFSTVAAAFNITRENATRYVAFATTQESLLWQYTEEVRPMFAYFDENDKIIGYYSL